MSFLTIYTFAAVIFITDSVSANTPDLVVGAYTQQGVRLSGSRTFSQCVDTCHQLGVVCFGVDYNWDNQKCFILVKRSSCDQSSLVIGSSWTHYRTDACGIQPADGRQSTTVCNIGSPYQAELGTAAGGFFLGVGTLNTCTALCSARSDCVSVVWSFTNGNTCFGHSSRPTVTTVTPNCCFVMTRICGTIVTTTPTTTTSSTTATTTTATTTTTTIPSTTPSTAPTTTPVNLNVATGLGTSGKCPDPFVKAPDSNQAGGTLLFSNTTEQNCLATCLADPTCGAVDYNYQNFQCFRHGEHFPPAFIQGERPCCAHFFRTDCGNQCYSVTGTAVAATDLTHNQVLVPNSNGVTLETCASDLCMTTVILDLANAMVMVNRACASSATLQDAFCDSATVSSTITTTCVCRGNRCNAVGSFLPTSYLPFDCHTSDFSGFLRDVTLTGVTFDAVDVARNWSAAFNGSAFAEIRSLQNIRLGSQNSLSLGSITIAFWMKRTEISGTMALANNGLRGQAPFEIVSSQRDNINHLITATFRVGTNTYSAQGLGFTFKWHFVAAVLNRLNSMVTVELYVTTADDTTSPTTVSQVGVSGPVADPSATTQLNLSNMPVTLGAVKTSSTTSLFFVPADYYTGFMDEFYIFDQALTMDQIQALVDETLSL